jgi:hypothetical protein
MAVMRLEVVGVEDIIGGHLRAATDSDLKLYKSFGFERYDQKY